MTSPTPSLFDAYSLRARLQPALLCILPASVVLLTLNPELTEPVNAILVATVSMGGTLLLSHLSRQKGQRLETRLYAEWGGKPSVRFLRHSDDTIDAHTKRRYTDFLRYAVGANWPTSADEITDAPSADRIYDSAGSWLKAQTRDPAKFRILFEENVSFGFRRNLLALKPLTILVSILSLMLIGLVYFGRIPLETRGPGWLLTGVAFILLYLLLTLLTVRKQWVKEAANSYALRLLETTDLLAQDRQGKKA